VYQLPFNGMKFVLCKNSFDIARAPGPASGYYHDRKNVQ
jgi:hypothetical protein